MGIAGWRGTPRPCRRRRSPPRAAGTSRRTASRARPARLGCRTGARERPRTAPQTAGTTSDARAGVLGTRRHSRGFPGSWSWPVCCCEPIVPAVTARSYDSVNAHVGCFAPTAQVPSHKAVMTDGILLCMRLTDRITAEGRYLFQLRSFMPLVLLPALYFALLKMARFELRWGHAVDQLWLAFCIVVSVLGLLMRCLTVGF